MKTFSGACWIALAHREALRQLKLVGRVKAAEFEHSRQRFVVKSRLSQRSVALSMS